MSDQRKPDPCGCVRTRDFKGYAVTQLCDRHLYEFVVQGKP